MSGSFRIGKIASIEIATRAASIAGQVFAYLLLSCGLQEMKKCVASVMAGEPNVLVL